MYISPLATALPLAYSCYITLWKIRSSVEMCVGICNVNKLLLCKNVTICDWHIKRILRWWRNACLSLFTNMRSKSEGRLLGQGLWSNLFFYLHINYAIAVLSSHSAWLIVFVFQKVGWNVRGVKCLRGEMSLGWNVPGWNVLGWNVFGVKCPDTLFPVENKSFLLLLEKIKK